MRKRSLTLRLVCVLLWFLLSGSILMNFTDLMHGMAWLTKDVMIAGCWLFKYIIVILMISVEDKMVEWYFHGLRVQTVGLGTVLLSFIS